MRLLDIALKDLLQIVRDWKSALFLVVMPILFTLFFGLVMNPIFAAEESDPRLPVGVYNQDAEGRLGEELAALMEASSVIRPVILDGSEAEETHALVEDGDMAAAVTIPAGYSERLLADEGATLAVIADEGSPAGQTAVTAVESASNRLLGAVEAAHISAETFASHVGFSNADARRAYVEEGASRAIAAWEAPPFSVTVQRGNLAEPADAPQTENGFVQSSPGMMVQFAIFGLITAAMVLVLERKTGALQRLMTTPIRPAEVIGGHVLAMFLVVFVQQLILIGLGQFLFGVDYLREPLAVLVVSVTLSLWAASLGLLISALSKGEDQVIVLSLVAMFLFASLGGAWFPLEVTGETFATIGHFTPTAWAMDGFQNIVLRGLGFSSVLLPAGVLLVYTLAFFGLAVWRFRYE
ncbi:MAG: ABC transporter permease [Candidatus Promineifilaceae bacterium]|nr:ABC transporter permease [Candidatus Promineifilaceae bacterium]